jgi:hypothetical protein
VHRQHPRKEFAPRLAATDWPYSMGLNISLDPARIRLHALSPFRGLHISTQLLSQLPHQPHDYRQHHAHQNRSRQRKIKSSVLPSINNVPWQPSQRQSKLPRDHHHQADDDQQRAQPNQNSTHLIHFPSLNSAILANAWYSPTSMNPSETSSESLEDLSFRTK